MCANTTSLRGFTKDGSTGGRIHQAMKKKEKKNGRERPVSLHPLKFEEAVADLLKVEPPPEKKRRGSREERQNTDGK